MEDLNETSSANNTSSMLREEENSNRSSISGSTNARSKSIRATHCRGHSSALTTTSATVSLSSVAQPLPPPPSPLETLEKGQVTAAERETSFDMMGKENHHKNDQKAEQNDRLCFECNSSMAKSQHLIHITGQAHKWHPECFKCHACNHPMDKETSCHVYKGKILCRADYAKIQRDNSTKCARCRWPISASDWVRKAAEHVYHLACFSCDVCLRQLSTGEQFTITSNLEDKNIVRLLCRLHFAIETPQHSDSNSQAANHVFTSTKNHQSDDSSNQTQNSTTLSSPTTSQLQFNYQQHNHATYNHESSQTISSQSHVNNTSLPPSQAYLNMLSQSADFNNTLSLSSEIQHQNHIDQYMGGSSSVVNEQPQQQHDSIGGAPSTDMHHMDGTQQNVNSNVSNEKVSCGISGITTAMSTSSGGLSSDPNGTCEFSGGIPSKSKRVRTTFTEDQLAILQTHFNNDSNPDGQELEQIAHKTRLSKRVTQVWFQNSRARQKKYAIKRKPSSGSTLPSEPHSIGLNGATSLVGTDQNRFGSSIQLCRQGSYEREIHNLQGYNVTRDIILTNNISTPHQNHHHQHQREDQHNHQQQQHSGKWSNTSDSADLSLDGVVDDENEDSHLSGETGGQLINSQNQSPISNSEPDQ